MSDAPAVPHLDLAEQLTVRSGGGELARYVMEPAPAFESPRPYWHPLRSPAGVVVSGNRPPDHSWHWGLSIAVSNIRIAALGEEVNLWGGVTWVRDQGYQQLPNNGTQRHEAWEAATDREVVQRLTWCTPAQTPFLDERRSVRVREADGGSGWVLETTSTWTNLTEGELRFGSPTTAGRPNAGYGGFFLRGGDLLLGADVDLDGERLSAEQARGRAGSAMTLTSPQAKVSVGMQASPANPVAPTPWFVRTDPVVMLCAAPFFHDEWPMPHGSTSTWSWRLVVTDVVPG
jgi:hypothetical protein